MREPSEKAKWRRRKTARPAEIIAAALAVFTERGFAAARLEEIAARAGVSKGALYLYFDSKDALFRAVVHDTVSPNVRAMATMIGAYKGPFPELVRRMLPQIAQLAAVTPVGRVAKMVIGESRNFPELARIWHDEVVALALDALAGLIERRQGAGELAPGDPRAHAFSIIGPILMSLLWRETFTPIGGAELDLNAIARQHAETIVGGMVLSERAAQAI